MKVKVWQLPFGFDPERRNLRFEEAGVLEMEMEKFDRGACWDAVNWASRGEEKPSTLLTTYEGSGIIFQDPTEDTYHVVAPFGWHRFYGWARMVNFLLHCTPEQYTNGKF